MQSDLVLTARRGSVMRITLNRVAKKNALTLAMYDQLTAGLTAAGSDDEVHSVLIAGAPGVFTAGNDLGDFMQQPPTTSDTPVFRFLQALIGFDKPVVAAVDGPAVGVGTTMLLHCDHVLATERARFHMPFTRLGLVPEAASSLLLPALVGRQRASEWLLLGRPFDAHEAVSAGLVNRIVPSAELEAASEAVGAELAALPKGAVIATKRLIGQGMRAAVGEALEREAQVFMQRLQAPETMAAFTAFMMKR
jgi:enoyl-CoA hydratase/carnithine racemase